jgi:hypothetical protein
MQLQYLDTLKQVGMSPSTKIVVPMELGGLLNGLKGILPNASAPAVGPVPAPPAPAPPAQVGPAVVVPPAATSAASNAASNGTSNDASNLSD